MIGEICFLNCVCDLFSDYIIPYCVTGDSNLKKGVNCIFENNVKTALELLTAIKPELQKRAIANKCFDQTLKPHMTSSEIVNFCITNYAIQDSMQIREDLHNLQILLFNNPDWGISVAQTENDDGLVSEDDIAKNMEQVIFNENDKITSLVMLKPNLPWKCTFFKTFYLALNSVLLVSLIFATLYLLNYGYKYYRHNEQKQKDEIGFMVEKIIDVLQSSCGEEGGEPFLVINHVRDMILPVVDRQKKGRTWAKAVKFINENESRVRTEIQEVKGEPFEVWRWIGSANLSMGGDRSDYIYRHGRRIVDAQYLISEVLKFPHSRFRFCTNSDVTIKNEVREGLLSVLVLRCQTCKKEHSVCSENPDSELMNVNLALVAGIVSLGLSLYHLNELCSSLHIPAISGQEYSQYLDEIYDIYNDSVKDSEKSVDSTFDRRVLRSSTPKKRDLENDYERKKSQFLKQLRKTPEEIKLLSNITINQRENPLWYEERKKRLTASNFGRICKLLDSTDRKKVAEELLHSTFTGNIYTKYGNDNEINAIKDFEKLLGQKVTSCGLFVHEEYPFLAASPDGLLGDDAIVEIKCPYKARAVTPEEGIKQKLIQFASVENGIFRLKKADKYYYQVQGQLFVTGREFCYFVVWTPHGMAYEKIGRDEELWNKMYPKLEEFYFEHLLPTIIGYHQNNDQIETLG